MGNVEMWHRQTVGSGSSPLVIHVPHAGTLIPDEVRQTLLLDDAELAAEIGRMTDWHTDRIALDALGASGVAGIIFANRLSRLVVDPERFLDDTEPMAAIGMGAVYQVTSELNRLRDPDPIQDQRLVDQWFHPYAAAFGHLIDETLAEHGHAVIVDLHSYPSAALPYELDPDAARPGICVGTDAVHTSAVLRDAAIAAFAGVDGGLAENTPFAGTYVPLPHWRRTPQVGSIMIEIRRDLYQTEPGGPFLAGYSHVTSRLASLLSTIVW